MAWSNHGASRLTEGSSGTKTTSTASVAVPNLGSKGVGLVVLKLFSTNPINMGVTSVTWDGSAMTRVGSAIQITVSQSIHLFRLFDPPNNKTLDVVVTWSDTETGWVQDIETIWAQSGSTPTIEDTDQTSSSVGGNSQNPTLTLTPSAAGDLVYIASVSSADTLGSPSQTGADTVVFDRDAGSNCGVTTRSAAPSTSNVTHTHNYGGSDLYGIIGLVLNDPTTNQPPTISPNTTDETDFEADTTPTLEFTGSDTDTDDLTYEIQITDNPNSFDDGVELVEEIDSGGPFAFTVHTNPTGGMTWEGHRQVDDRLGQVFFGHGGILDSIAFNFSPFESDPTKTNGHYLVRVYLCDDGVLGDNLPLWEANTAYSEGDIVKNPSSANGVQQFAYTCTVGGTSDSEEPEFTEIENDTFSDGSVTWRANRGAGPLNPAAPADTPTPGWIAQSEVIAYNPGTSDGGFKTVEFEDENRIRLAEGAKYVAILDWRPADTDIDNGITCQCRFMGTHPGNAYIDGASVGNNGPRVGDDTEIRVWEEYTLLSKASNADAGFVNTVSGGDTDPFNSGQKIAFTVQAGDALVGGRYFWRARCKDPGGANTFSSYTATRAFLVDFEYDPDPGGPGEGGLIPRVVFHLRYH